jgi:hypothetical protein
VIYIDNYGNVVTNITKKLFEDIRKTRDFEILVRNKKFTEYYQNYADFINFDIPADKRQDDGRGIIVFNAAGYLEIAIYKSNLATGGGASSLFGLDFRDPITIKFQ